MTISQITTARIHIILPGMDHAPLLQQYYQSNGNHLAPWEPARAANFYDLPTIEQRLQENRQLAQEDRGYALVLLNLPRTEIIGVCNFNNIVRGVFQACHLGYSVSALHQGQGLMFEALQALLPWAFDELDLHRVMANYMVQNARSGNLLTRLGFEREGVAKKYLKIAGQWQDHVLTAKVRGRD